MYYKYFTEIMVLDQVYGSCKTAASPLHGYAAVLHKAIKIIFT